MIHEMMHAFMTDYLFNLSQGTGRDGVRVLEKDSKGNIDAGNPFGDYFSISTIRMSKVALGGGRRTSYDPLLFALTAEEEAERDYCYIGDEQEYIDLSLEED